MKRLKKSITINFITVEIPQQSVSSDRIVKWLLEKEKKFGN